MAPLSTSRRQTTVSRGGSLRSSFGLHAKRLYVELLASAPSGVSPFCHQDGSLSRGIQRAGGNAARMRLIRLMERFGRYWLGRFRIVEEVADPSLRTAREG